MRDLTDLFKGGRLVGFITDAKGQIVATTPGAERIQGTSLKDVTGLTLPPSTEDGSILRSLSQVRSSGSPMHVVLLLQAGSGQVLTLHVEDFAVRETSGEFKGWFAAGQELGRYQAEARCAQSILTTLVDSIGAAFWAFDKAGVVSTWSHPCETMFGISRAEAEGKLATERLFASAEALGLALREAGDSGRFSGELELLDREGAPRSHHVSISRLSTAQDEVLGYACVAIDISTRKRLEELQRVLFEESRAGVLMAECDTLRVTSANGKAADLLAIAREAIVGKPLLEAIPGFDPSTARRETAGDQASGDGLHERTFALTRNDAPLHLETRSRLIRLGAHEYFLIDLRDVTVRVLEAARLSEAHAFLETIRGDCPEPLLLLDEHAILQYANAAAARLAGLERESLQGSTLEGILAPDRREQFRANFRKALESGPSRFRAEILRPDRTRVAVDISAGPIASPARRWVLVLLHDITEQVRSEEELRDAHEDLEKRLDGITADLTRVHSALQDETADRERVEKSLRAGLERSVRQESALAGLLRKQALRAQEPGDAIRLTLESAADALEVERVSVWRFAPDRASLRALAIFERAARRHVLSEPIDAQAFPDFFKALADGKTLAAEEASREEATRRLWKERLSSGGVTSTIHVPIHLGSALEGILALEHCGPPRAWEPDERAFAAALAGITALLLRQADRVEAERRLAVQAAVTRLLAGCDSAAQALPALLRTVGEGLSWVAGAFWGVDHESDVLRCGGFWSLPGVQVAEFAAATRKGEIAPGADLPGRVRATSRPAWIPDVVKDDAFPRSPQAAREGLHAAFAVPVLDGVNGLGVLEFISRDVRDPDPDLLSVLGEIGREFGQFLARRRAQAETFRRVEEARRAYEELKKAQSALIRSEKLSSISMLLSGFAREMNAPLGAIQGKLKELESASDEMALKATEGIRGKKVSEVQKRNRALRGTIRGTAEQAQRALGMVEDFGELSRDPRSGEPVDLLPLIDEALALLPKRLLKPGVKVVKQVKPLPPLRCIPGQIVQVLQHLLQNAAESIEKKGTIQVRAEARKGSVAIEVSDTGSGMAPEVQALVFDPFFTTKSGRSGMGLSLAAMIVQNHGGKIGLKSKPGRGSTFTVELPLQE